MNKIILLFALLLFYIPLKLKAQLTDTINNELFQQKLESISENSSSEDIDFTALEERLQFYTEHPLNLNSATAAQLQSLLILNDLQVNNLINHIELNGKLLNVYELQSIEGFDLQTINNLMPYINVKDTEKEINKLRDQVKGGKHKLVMRYQRVLEHQKGYENKANGFLGSPDKLYTRYQFNSGNRLMIGFTAEKDPGEQFFRGTQKKGFDFYSAHLFLSELGKLKVLAVGDYQLQFGQGLVAWSGLAFSKTADAIAIKRNAAGIRPHTTADENLFLRGAAMIWQMNKVYITGFVSRKRIDANITHESLNGVPTEASSLQQSGEHATLAELSDKQSIQQSIIGGDIAYKSKKWDIGNTTLFNKLSAGLNPDLKLYNKYNFRGTELLNSSLHYGVQLRNFNFFGEMAYSSNGGLAYLNGLLIALDKKLSLSLLNRNYQRNYQSLQANAFSEASSPMNESGTYVGLQIKPIASLVLNSYLDFFSSPWLKYQVTAPSQGYEYYSQLTYTPNKKFSVYGHFRTKQKQNDLNTISEINIPVPVRQNNYRINLSYIIGANFRIVTRVEWLTWNQSGLSEEKGFLISQDLHLHPFKFPLQITLRYALFATDSYNSRIYAFENDMPYTYSIPAYYQRGSRVYCLLSYNLSRQMTCWLRYSQTFYDNLPVISPGAPTEINGNTKSEVKAEIRFTF